MKKNLFISLVLLPIFGFTQVVLNQVDDFEDYTPRNWTKSSSTLPNQNITTGGPLGLNDNFLRVQSPANGQLVTFNKAQWMGDYYKNDTSGRVKYISMDVRNSGTNIIFLRLAFTNDNWTGTDPIFASINAIAVLPGEGWKKINFPITETAMTNISTVQGYTSVFSNVTEVRILHNDSPAWDSDPIEATLDIDNIMARSTPLLLGVNDFEEKKKMKLYPNPSNESIIFSSNENLNENFKYNIFDLAGKQVLNGTSKFNEKINIKNLTEGNYFIQIETKKGEIFKEKLIKN
ncbi:T9SS type A sorting domain-containing protein [uncultured Chryseobacterium sp.]|uniref:T9SS type A sorting domain-containing protein n=1 Tax=uncultured Chryseobacterium sp. TaxID=259322 RepID=UPI002589FF8D|nr:T9SS type A sorting domain-containing protein [uncultured Chryseobacterium sp.]